jgi:hypothetical protein
MQFHSALYQLNTRYVAMIDWVQSFIAPQSALTPTACYAASANPRTKTIYDNVPHYLTVQNVIDTGRLGQK